MPGDSKKHLKPCICVQINTQWSSRGTEPTFYQDSHFVGVLQSFQYISGVFFCLFHSAQYLLCIRCCVLPNCKKYVNSK